MQKTGHPLLDPVDIPDSITSKVLTKEKLAAFYNSRKKGMNVRDSCSVAGISQQYYNLHKNRNDEFREFVTRAVKEGSMERFDDLIKASKEGSYKASKLLLNLSDPDYGENSLKEPYRKRYIESTSVDEKMDALDEALAMGKVSTQAYKAFVDGMEKRANLSRLDELEKKNKALYAKIDELLGV